MADIDNFRQLLQYFVAHLEFCEANSKGSSTLIKTRGYDDYIVNNHDFKRTGGGYNDDDIQKQIAGWENYSNSKICITVSNGNPEGNYKNLKQNYLQWKGTDNDIRASWNTNKITELVITIGEKEIKTLNVTDNLYDKAGRPVIDNTDELKSFWEEFNKLRPDSQNSITNQIGDILNLNSINSKTQYWRLNIDPDKWNIRQAKIGAEESFGTRNGKNRKPNYQSAKKDDVVLGYETESQAIVSLLVVSKPDDGQEIYFKKILDVNADFLTREEIINNQKTKDALKPSQTTFIPVPTDKFVEIISMMIKKGVLKLEDLLNAIKVPSHPLNLILYGPPGTGKTYNTLFKALAIINNKSIDTLIGEKYPGKSSKDNLTKEEYKSFKEDFDKLVDSGQIVFTTFHQSMSYEDFIEGIKPIPDKINVEAEHKNNPKSTSTLFGDGTTIIKNLSRMKYEVKPGIFKQICEKAKANSTSIVSAQTAQSLSDIIKDFLSNAQKNKTIYKTKSGKKFAIDKVDAKDIYINLKQDGLKNNKLKLKIQTIESLIDNGIIELEAIKEYFRNKVRHQEDSYYYAIIQEINKIKNTSNIIQETKPQYFVLIIDEINRGNVAQIFGELITLIEPSKRLGNSEEMNAILPYSSAQKGEPVYFGVPNNLYIIGTMNTADRSVEALDTALRRRFSFEEMMPKPELLGDKELCDVKLSDLLTTINQRIVALKDREHQIGHSYFMGCPDDNAKAETWLTGVFKDKIIPLLQEYFYGDYKKIYYVLGPGFVKEIPENENKPEDIFPVKTDDDIDIDGSTTRYIIKSFEEGDDKINIKAAVNRLIKSKRYEDNLRTRLKGKKFIEIIIDENGKKQKTGEPIDADKVVERVLCGEDESKFEEETTPNPEP